MRNTVGSGSEFQGKGLAPAVTARRGSRPVYMEEFGTGMTSYALILVQIYNEHYHDFTMNTFMTNSVTKHLITLCVEIFPFIPLLL